MCSIINLLEVQTSYNDSWNLTFYYVLSVVLMIGFFWTYMQVFVKPKKKKEPLKENIIYQNEEDTIEESYKDEYNVRKKSNRKK